MKRSPLDELIDAERNDPPRPSSAEAKSCWQRIQHSAAIGAAVPFDVAPASVAPVAAKSATLSTTAKIVLAAVVTGGATVAAIATSSDEPPARPASAEPTADATPQPPRRPRVRPAVVPAMVPEPEPAPPVEAPSELDEVAPQPEASAHPTPRKRTHKRRHAPEPTGIGKELQLIAQARRALSRKDHGRALRILAAHEREFPQGAMEEDRAALRVVALCGAGRLDEGRTEGRAFLSRWPRSVHADRVDKACTDEAPAP